nr:transcription factor bHLH118-like [Ipomoea batatas]
MFPLQRCSDELAYQILSDPHPHLPCQQNTISEDLILDFDYTSNSCPLLDTNNDNSNVNNCSSSSSRKRKQKAAVFVAANTHPEKDEKLKKIVHRDVERRRRKEMATLYSSLRSLLPVEYVKRKRSSASEYMQAAVNYIEQMHTNLKELERSRRGHGCSSGYVSVNGCRDGGLEILVDTGCKLEERFPLSTLLRTLLSEGVEVESCVSTTTSHGRLLHRLHSKVCREICVDVGGLQQKLSGVLNASRPNVSRVCTE